MAFDPLVCPGGEAEESVGNAAVDVVQARRTPFRLLTSSHVRIVGMQKPQSKTSPSSPRSSYSASECCGCCCGYDNRDYDNCDFDN
ncbi:unnamed protein product [Diplocarpon coronariae]|nr:hypothetical protein JHW43_008375 [Diplocarpon mali]